MSGSARAQSQPFLKANVDAFRHVYRGEVWYLLHDRALDRYYRISAEAARMLGTLDTRRGLKDGVAPFEIEGIDEADTARFLSHLRASGLLRTGETITAADIAAQRKALARRRWKAMAKSPIGLRLPLFDPTPLLDRLGWLERLVFARSGLWALGLVILTGMIAALVHWGAIASNITDKLISMENLAVASIVYVVMKAVHETAHALTLRHFGGEVRRVGLIFVLLMPVPYVDASTSSTFANKYRRMAVASAGIVSELFMGSLAVFGWILAEPGLFRTVCFDILMISGFSTLLFNGNPLQRYDGYYILCDLIEVPDLGSRSTAYIGFLARRYLLGAREEKPPRTAPGETSWFLLYGPASFIYRQVLMLSIAMFAAQSYPVIGATLAVWMLAGAMLTPVIGLGKRLRKVKKADRYRMLGRSLLVAGGLAGLLFLVPLPNGVVAPGIVWLPDSAIVRTAGTGEIDSLLEPQGGQVTSGQIIARLSNYELRQRLAVAEARLSEAEATFRSVFMRDHAQAGIEAQKVAAAREERDVVTAEIARLDVKVNAAGTLVYADPVNLPGTYLHEGTQIAIVWNGADSFVRCFLPLWEIDRIRSAGTVSLRFAFDPHHDVPGDILRIVPAATDRLPSPVLSLEGGGPYAIASHTKAGPTLTEAVFEVVVRPREPLRVDLFQGRVNVRFDLGWEPAGYQILRAARLVFLRQLDV